MDIDTAWVLKLSNFDTTSGGWPLKFTKGQLSHIPWSYFVTWGAFRDATLSLPFSNQMLNFKDHPMPESIGIYWGLLESFEIHWNPAFFVFFCIRRSSLVGHGATPAKPITLGLSARGAAAGESSEEDGHGGAGLGF